MKEKKNEYQEELDKFVGNIVAIKDIFGDIHKGILLGYNPLDLSVILMTEEEKILLKNYYSIIRVRDISWKKNSSKKEVK